MSTKSGRRFWNENVRWSIVESSIYVCRHDSQLAGTVSRRKQISSLTHTVTSNLASRYGMMISRLTRLIHKDRIILRPLSFPLLIHKFCVRNGPGFGKRQAAAWKAQSTSRDAAKIKMGWSCRRHGQGWRKIFRNDWVFDIWARRIFLLCLFNDSKSCFNSFVQTFIARTDF